MKSMKKLEVLAEKLEASEMLRRLQTVTDYRRMHTMDVHRQFHLQKDKEEIQEQMERRIKEIRIDKRMVVRKYHKHLFKAKKDRRKGPSTEKNGINESSQEGKIKIEVHLPTVKLERENTFYSPDDAFCSESEAEEYSSDTERVPRKHSTERTQRKTKVMMVKPLSLSLPDINENSVFTWQSNSVSESSSVTDRTPTPCERSDSVDTITRLHKNEQTKADDNPQFRNRSRSLAGLTRSHTQFPKIKEEPQFLRARSQSFHTIGLLKEMDKNSLEKKALRRMSQSHRGMLKFKYFAKLMTHSIKELKEEMPDEEPKTSQEGLYREMSSCRYLRIPSHDV